MSELSEPTASGQPAEITRSAADGVYTILAGRPGCRELFITARAQPGAPVGAMLARIAEALDSHDARIVSQVVFYLDRDQARTARAIADQWGPPRWPITWLASEGGADAPGGMLIYAVSGPPVEPIMSGSRVIGSFYQDALARYCMLGDLRDGDGLDPRPVQAERVLDQMASALAEVDMSFAHVLRTWFYNDDILGWYDEFNAVRTGYFKTHGVFDGLVPASTGIGARNPFGAALTGGLIAVAPATKGVSATALRSPLQSAALDYGSSFSRAVELTSPHTRRVFVSGTASIAPDGLTQCVGDAAAQVERTMDVVAAIFESRGMGWADVCSGVAYVRNADHARAYRDYCAAAGLGDLPVVLTCNTVCRDDLLFELEADAIAPVGP